MGKQYRIRIRGKQRENIDTDLMAQLVVMLGRKLAADAAQAAAAAHAPAQEPAGEEPRP